MGQQPLLLKEVLPMVADFATIISFVTLVLMKLFTVPLLSEWLTLLAILSRKFRGFFCMPAVATFRMDFCMAGLAKGNQVIFLMCTALR